MNNDALANRYGENLVTRVKILVEKAKKYHVKIATAESLTAGGIAHLIDSVDPDHEVLSCGKAVYNNNAKAEMLGVSREDLQEYEAVSEPVARQMAEGALNTSGAQISVAVTGYAGAGGDPSRNIDGSTVFIGASHQLPGDETATHVEEFHFDKARSLDIRKTIIAAIGALELELDAYITKEAELKGTITDTMQAGFKHDPWLASIKPDTLAEYRMQAGEITDPLLAREYEEDAVKRVKNFLVSAKKANQKVAVVGDGIASEIAHMLTTLNGSSSVVDRAYILPSAIIQQRILKLDAAPFVEDNAKLAADDVLSNSPATLVVSAFKLDEDSAVLALSSDAKPHSTQTEIIHFSDNKPKTRQVAEHALGLLERTLVAQQEQANHRAG